MGNLKVISKNLFSAAFSPASQSVGENIEKSARFSILADFFELGYRIARAGSHPWSPFDLICVGWTRKQISETGPTSREWSPAEPFGREREKAAHPSKIRFSSKIDYPQNMIFRLPGGGKTLFRAAYVKLHEILLLLCPGLFLCNRLHHVENRLEPSENR